MFQASNLLQESRKIYPQANKRRKTISFEQRQDNDMAPRTYNAVFQNTNNVASTTPEQFNPTDKQLLFKDTNNNRNNRKEIIIHQNVSSKSFIENPKKGKSIKRKSYNTHHVSFEGSQAPQALSVQITSPRHLHPDSPLWNQPSTSYNQVESTTRLPIEEECLDDSALTKDFQRLLHVQRLYPNCQIQSTPRIDVTAKTFRQNTVYSSSIGPKMLFD